MTNIWVTHGPLNLLSCAGILHTLAQMEYGAPTEAEQRLLRLVRVAAEQHAAKAGITVTDYLIGMLEGKFPPFDRTELEQIEKAERQMSSPN
jgi:hypothetical protein